MIHQHISGRQRGLTGSIWNVGSSGPSSSPGPGHCLVLLGETVSALSECLAPPYEWLFENYQPDMQGVTCYGLAFHPGSGGGKAILLLALFFKSSARQITHLGLP